MDHVATPKDWREEPRLNILLLDGGGVRGLSSLLLLEALMSRINQEIRIRRPTMNRDVLPQELFVLIAGTSTGGLIALMLVKIGMTIAECKEQYRTLSRAIFGKMYIRKVCHRLTLSLGLPKYSGSNLRARVQSLLRARNLDEEEPMVSEEASGENKILCAVVCREHLNPSKYSKYRIGGVSICNLDCQAEESILCPVPDAARATSAAPTYFDVAKIMDHRKSMFRYFSDGGVETNNPTWTIHKHYNAIAKTQIAQPSQQTPQVPRHGDLEFNRIRYINLGTGTKTNELQRRRDKVASAVPGMIRMGVFLKETLTQVAVEAEKDADHMRITAAESGGRIKFERYSADNGVCFIKLYEHGKLDEIQELTEEYLSKPTVQESMTRVAGEMADEWIASHPE